MRIFNKATIRAICEENIHASALKEWAQQAQAADWSCMNDIVQSCTFSPSPVGDDRVVFNIQGNRYRPIVRVDFVRKAIDIHWFGTHREYDRIDALTVPPLFS